MTLIAHLLSGCAGAQIVPQSEVVKTVPPSLRVPASVERLAVLYPTTGNQHFSEAYAQLEGVAFQLKEQRPTLRIVERSELTTIVNEHRFQLGGAVSEHTAIRLGRVLGVDSVLLYLIQGPTSRDLMLARFYGGLPPFTVTSKIILVESGEVVFYNVVTSRVERRFDEFTPFYGRSPMQPVIRAALDRGVAQTTADLWNAFR